MNTETTTGAGPVDQPVRPQRADVVPGVMRCARCKFRLQRVNLYVNVGTVGAGDNNTEPCPNGCGPLWPVTWEQEAREGYKTAEDLFERAKSAEDALAARKPLNADDAVRLWHLAAEAHASESAFEWFAAGILAAERAHRITGLDVPNTTDDRPSVRSI